MEEVMGKVEFGCSSDGVGVSCDFLIYSFSEPSSSETVIVVFMSSGERGFGKSSQPRNQKGSIWHT